MTTEHYFIYIHTGLQTINHGGKIVALESAYRRMLRLPHVKRE